MNAIEKVINKASWRYHMNGGYWEKEILDGDVLDQAASELAELRAENEKLKTDFVQMTHNCVGAEMEADALRAVVEAARKEHSLLNSVMNWMQEEKIEIPFIMGVLVGSLGEADEQLAAALARVDGEKGQ